MQLFTKLYITKFKLNGRNPLSLGSGHGVHHAYICLWIADGERRAEVEAVDVMVGLAENEVSQAELAAWLASNVQAVSS